MNAVSRVVMVCLLAFLAAGHVARADDAALCRAAIGAAETSQRIPDAFLAAIARVESGRPDARTGALAAWPWTINAEGAGSFYATKAEAVDAVRALQARGVRSIDVGCLQVNLLNHPEAFASLDQAFDPFANASFAGRFLISLFDKMGSWPLAAAAYHSQTPTIGAAYQRRVLAEWAVPNSSAVNGPAQRPGASGARQSAGQSTAAEAAGSGPAGLPQAGVQSAAALPAFGRTPESTFHGAQPGGMGFTGRSLAAYRLMPTAFALRLPRKSG